ncbi:MAG: ferritin-like domain-containing protein [Ginsengibacter sp.]
MESMINLKDLLTHEILDLYSAEKQIIEALPEMIENAYSVQLKNALLDHLEVTKTHKERLEKVYEKLTENKEEAESLTEDKGFFSRLFGGVTEPKCKGTEGLIKEGKKIMDEDMTSEVRDAAIIAATQKIEHYEISGYGTALAYARQLSLEFVATLLEETLNEEYEADDLLTELAVGQLNIDAENAVENYNIHGTGIYQQNAKAATEGSSLFADDVDNASARVADASVFADNRTNSINNNDL